MGEVAGHDREHRVGLMLVDVGDGRVEAGARIEAIKLPARVRKMRVGEVDEFEWHARVSGLWEDGRLRQDGPPAG